MYIIPYSAIPVKFDVQGKPYEKVFQIKSVNIEPCESAYLRFLFWILAHNSIYVRSSVPDFIIKLKMFGQPSSLDLLKKSKSFQLMFVLSISCSILGTMFCLFFPFTICGYQIANVLTCNQLSQVFTTEAQCFEKTYCCYQYASCGDSSQCFIKPTSQAIANTEPCIGIFIVGSILLCLSPLFALITCIIFCRIKRSLNPVRIEYVQAILVNPQQKVPQKADHQPQPRKQHERDLTVNRSLEGNDEHRLNDRLI